MCSPGFHGPLHVEKNSPAVDEVPVSENHPLVLRRLSRLKGWLVVGNAVNQLCETTGQAEGHKTRVNELV